MLRMNLRTLFGHKTSWLRHFPKTHQRIRSKYLVRHAMGVPMGDGMVLCRILGPYKFYCDPDDRGISPHIIMDGYWEPRTTEAIIDRLGLGMTAIDAGANLGYFTMLMGLMVGETGRVLSFEPVAASVRRLKYSLLINGLVERTTVYQEPLGDEEGRAVDIIIPENLEGGAHVANVPLDGRRAVAARTRRLDMIPGALDATLVKIDTEGMEHAIWRGMAGMIAGPNLRHIIVEFTRDGYSDPGAFLDEVTAAGFRLMHIHDRDGVVPTTREKILAGPWLQMLLFER